MSEIQVYKIRPPTDEDIELISNIAIVSFSVSLIAVLVFLGCTLYIALKTGLPGRLQVTLSAFSFLAILLYVQYMGGSLETVFGPIGQLYSVIAYSIPIALFSIGFLKICIHFKRHTELLNDH
ncbi:MAG: hypothetical protein OQK04_19235 [Kangiellaceae bacterium]|nr:hypothetical protein [Kangiellaceae bacterium]MCW9000853.1 hypothetical protein [Kangiellaceae bacterium]